MPARAERPIALYILNVALLATHQVDAAYWEEWDTLRLPIGIEGFLVFNVVVLLPVLYGLVQVGRGASSAAAWSYAIAGLGAFTFGIHAVLLALGNDDFRSAPSLGLLAAIGIVSLAQAFVTRREMSEAPNEAV